MNVPQAFQAKLTEIQLIYNDAKTLESQLESLRTIEQAQAEYTKLVAEEEEILKKLGKRRRELEREKHRLINPKRNTPIQPPPQRSFTTPSRVTPGHSSIAHINSTSPISKRPGTAARSNLKRLINRYYRSRLDAVVLGQINRIADDTDHLLGEALVLLDWGIFEDYVNSRGKEETKLEQISEWGKELETYCKYLSTEIELQENRFSSYLEIWKRWQLKQQSPEHLHAWETLIEGIKHAKQVEIAQLEEDIAQLQQDLAQLKLPSEQMGERL